MFPSSLERLLASLWNQRLTTLGPTDLFNRKFNVQRRWMQLRTKGLVSAEGIESTLKRIFNNMQVSG
jgi:hypothetical protein